MTAILVIILGFIIGATLFNFPTNNDDKKPDSKEKSGFLYFWETFWGLMLLLFIFNILD